MKPVKLFTWKHWLLSISAVAVGSSLSLYLEYRDTRSLQGSTIIISAITFIIGVGIIASVSWYGNRPEPKEKQ
jgi:hypothetical protein